MGAFSINAILYRGTLKGKVGIQERLSLAENFYKEVGGNARDINGINFSNSVSKIPLDGNLKLYQWTIDGKLGDYFSLSPNAKALGIPQMADGTPAFFDRMTGEMLPRTLMQIELPAGSKVNGLKSTASDVPSWDGSPRMNKGGSTQIYAPGVKTKNPTVKPVN